MRIYVDLDNTLVASDIDPYTGDVKKIYPRPGAYEFLSHLAPYGPIKILTKAMRSHLERALRKLGPAAAKLVKGAITREDMRPVEDRLEAILTAPISDESKQVLIHEIEPIYPKGVIFDNEPPYTDGYLLKTAVVGVSFDEWVEVEPFDVDVPDMGGLEQAFSKFLERYPGFSLKGVYA